MAQMDLANRIGQQKRSAVKDMSLKLPAVSEQTVLAKSELGTATLRRDQAKELLIEA